MASKATTYRLVQEPAAFRTVRSLQGQRVSLQMQRHATMPAAWEWLQRQMLDDYNTWHDQDWAAFLIVWRRWHGMVPGFRAGSGQQRKQVEIKGNALLNQARECQLVYDGLLEAAGLLSISLPELELPSWIKSARNDRALNREHVWLRAEDIQMSFDSSAERDAES